MSAPKFIDELPPEAPRNKKGRPASRLFIALRQQPGRWAEVGRYSVADRNKALQRSAYVKKYYADMEATTRTVGGEVIVFARATVTDGADQ